MSNLQSSFSFTPVVGQRVRIIVELFAYEDFSVPLQGVEGTICKVGEHRGQEAVDIRLDDGMPVGRLYHLFGSEVEIVQSAHAVAETQHVKLDPQALEKVFSRLTKKERDQNLMVLSADPDDLEDF